MPLSYTYLVVCFGLWVAERADNTFTFGDLLFCLISCCLSKVLCSLLCFFGVFLLLCQQFAAGHDDEPNKFELTTVGIFPADHHHRFVAGNSRAWEWELYFFYIYFSLTLSWVFFWLFVGYFLAPAVCGAWQCPQHTRQLIMDNRAEGVSQGDANQSKRQAPSSKLKLDSLNIVRVLRLITSQLKIRVIREIRAHERHSKLFDFRIVAAKVARPFCRTKNVFRISLLRKSLSDIFYWSN